MSSSFDVGVDSNVLSERAPSALRDHVARHRSMIVTRLDDAAFSKQVALELLLRMRHDDDCKVDNATLTCEKREEKKNKTCVNMYFYSISLLYLFLYAYYILFFKKVIMQVKMNFVLLAHYCR